MAEEPVRERGFLARWSQRKRAAVEEDVPTETGPDALPADDTETEKQPEAVDEALAAELEENRLAAEAVDIDSLSYEDDFKVFLKRGVPEALKKQALRKLWRSNPILANLDGLNDYDDDFGDPSANVYKSLWALGRGFLSEAEQKAQYAAGRLTMPEPSEDAAEALAGTGEPEPDFEAPAESPEAEDKSDGHQAEEVAVAEAEEAAPDSEQEEEDAAPRRVSIRRRLEG
ncbi:DUF3306 domain-containing protein [Oricola cellulosilytica]|uniref:DUF3306 domain-containing protein n=1 Tax=Oricola cellulosilytica TaxID=1429082 RepID=A0A4V2MN97_9HYPH|nr:DUF3306 domain-containing protein [Oricola cellulosilytica]TCD11908.1 DUF3306 domain-containing protein [Oricola cellulosilytica]